MALTKMVCKMYLSTLPTIHHRFQTITWWIYSLSKEKRKKRKFQVLMVNSKFSKFSSSSSSTRKILIIIIILATIHKTIQIATVQIRNSINIPMCDRLSSNFKINKTKRICH